MSIVEIKDSLQYYDVLRDNTNVVLDIFADWCKPCKELEPGLISFNKKYNEVKIVKVHIENLEDMCLDVDIPKTIPTLYFYKEGKLLDVFSGTNLTEIKKHIEKLIK
jgi:thioredoxin 1